MKFIAGLIVILLLASVPAAHAQAKPNKPNKKKSGTATIKKENGTEAEQKQKFTTSQIDISLDKLPFNYHGNDPKMVYSVLEQREKSSVKGEFETTEQFQKRVQTENNLPIIGQISSDGLLSLQAERTDIRYSADASEFSIEIKLDKVSEPLGYRLAILKDPSYKSDNYNGNAKAISLSSALVGSRSYTASNKFGATTVVEERNYESYECAIANYNDFPVNETIREDAQRRAKKMEETYKRIGSSYRPNTYISDYDKEWHISTKIKASVDEAKAIKENITVLLVGKLHAPSHLR